MINPHFLCYNPITDQIITSGEDGNINTWNLSQILKIEENAEKSLLIDLAERMSQNCINLKFFKSSKNDHFVTLEPSQHRINVFKLVNNVVSFIDSLDFTDFKITCLTTVSDRIIVGTDDGRIIVLDFDASKQQKLKKSAEIEVLDSENSEFIHLNHQKNVKINSITCINNHQNLILVSSHLNLLTLIDLTQKTKNIHSRDKLANEKKCNWHLCSYFNSSKQPQTSILIGDKNGTLHLFSLDIISNYLYKTDIVSKLHGKYGVYCLVGDRDFVYSCGSDNAVNMMRIGGQKVILLQKFNLKVRGF